jgi:hypothetical protein
VETAEKKSHNEGKNLTMKEKIARTKASANTRYSERIKIPTSRSSLIVSPGEGRATREAEMIYWPDLYALTGHIQVNWSRMLQVPATFLRPQM